MRGVIVTTLVVCLLVAIAPWLKGGQDPLGMLISGFALLLAELLLMRQPEARRLKPGPMAVGFVGLVAFACVSLLWTSNNYSTGLWIVQWVLALLVFRLSYVIAGEPQGRQLMVTGYLVSVAVFAVWGVGMFLFAEYGRLTGTFYWANPAAAYLIPAVVLAVDAVRRSKGRTQWLWTLGAAGFLAAFLLTDSRAATAVLLVVSLLYLLIYRLGKHFWIHFLFILVCGWLLSLGLVYVSTKTAHHTTKAVPGSRFAEAVRGESSSGSDRLYFINSALEMWFDAPVGGKGAGTYGDEHPKYQHRVVSASANAHNVYIQILAELGLIGFSLLCMGLLGLMFGALRGLARRPQYLPVAVGLAGLLLHMALDIDATYPALLGLAATLAGLIYAQGGERRGPVRFTGILVTLAVLAPILSLYLDSVHRARGESAQLDQDYELAAEEFGRAHAGFMVNPDMISAEGIALYALGVVEPAKAKDSFAVALDRARQASAMDPLDGQHHQLAGRVLIQMNDLAAAEKEFRLALAADPYNHPDYALDLTVVLARVGRLDEAVATARSMLDLYPDDVVNNRNGDPTIGVTLANLEAFIGNVALDKGDLVAARTAAARALVLDRTNLRGRALMRQVEQRSVPAAAQ